MPVHDGLGGLQWLQRQHATPRAMLSNQKFLEKKRHAGKRPRLLPITVAKKFIAEREQAGRLQPDHRHPTLHERAQRVEHPASLLFGLLNQSGGQEGTTTAKRTLPLLSTEGHSIACRLENCLGCAHSAAPCNC